MARARGGRAGRRRGLSVRRLLLLALLLAAGTLTWVALRGRPARPEPERLVPHENVLAALADGELVRSTVAVDVGTPRGQAQTLEADRRLGLQAEGFLSQPAGTPPYAWTVGRCAQVRLDVLEPAERELLVQVANGTAGPQAVELVFNGTVLLRQALPESAELWSLTAPVPAALQRRGGNLLELRFDAVSPRTLLGEPRELPLSGLVNHIVFAAPGRTRDLPPPAPARAGLVEQQGPGGPTNVLLLPSDCAARAPLVLPGAPRVALRLFLQACAAPLAVSLLLDERRVPLRALPAGTPPSELELDLTPWAGRTAVLELHAGGLRDAPGAELRIGPAQVLVPEGWAQAQPTPMAPPAAPPLARRPSFLVVVLDAFAGRYANRVVNGSLVTPALAALADNGLWFPGAQAPASYTLASVASLLTGQEPLVHGVLGTLGPTGAVSTLAPGAPRLAEALRAAGWRTAAFVTNPNAAGHHGFAAGFEEYDELFRDPALWREHRGVAGEALPGRLQDFLARVEGQSFLAWVHVFEPHAPYESPADLRERFVRPYAGEVRGDYAWIEAFKSGRAGCDEAGWQHLRELYAARAASADRVLARLLQQVVRAGRGDDTVVIVVGDHGESLGERGLLEHGDAVPPEQLHVPLFISAPALGLGKGVREGLVALQDVAPTVLRLAGLAPLPGMQGADLLAGPPDPARPLAALSSVFLPELSWRHGRHRLLVDLLTRRVRLYDTVADPGETRDLAEALPATRALLLRELGAHVCAAEAARAGRDEVATVALDPALREQLAQTGYLEALEAAPGAAPRSLCAELRRLLRRL